MSSTYATTNCKGFSEPTLSRKLLASLTSASSSGSSKWLSSSVLQL